MIVVFGSINIDLIVPVAHLPAPGETVLGGDYTIAPGGKGANQALAARRAGSEVVMAGAVGGDGFAATALSLLRDAEVDLSHVASSARPTGCATITVDPDGENQIAVAPGANLDARAAQIPDPLLGPRTVLVLQREVSIAENAALIQRARMRGARIVFSLAPAGPIAPARFDDIDIIIANESEAAVADLGSRPREALIVTHGAAGTMVLVSNGPEFAVPTLPITPVDTTGAGDTFVGVLAAGLDHGLALDAALRRASAAAALACLAIGAQSAMPDRAAIDIAMSRLPR